MKKIFKISQYLIFLFLTVEFVFAQVRTKDIAAGKSNSTLFVNAQVNGKTFISKRVIAKKIIQQGKKGVAIIAVGDNGSMQFKINKDLKVGTFAINSTDKKSVLMFTPKNSMPFATSKCSDATGVFTVTDFSENSMSGTFSFTGKHATAKCEVAEKLTVTKGSFKVTF